MKTKTCLLLLVLALALMGCGTGSAYVPPRNLSPNTPTPIPPPTASPALYHPILTFLPTPEHTRTPAPQRLTIKGETFEICSMAAKAHGLAKGPVEIFTEVSGKACLPTIQWYWGAGEPKWQTISLVHPDQACPALALGNSGITTLRVYVLIGDQPGQMKRLPSNYTAADLAIYTAGGTVAFGELLQVSGRVISNDSFGSCHLTSATLSSP
jgi:hypothetical protein